jgi:hypothetical protein
MNKALLLCCFVLLVSGCGTMNQMDNSVVSEGFRQVYKDYVIDVTSDPPGAKITWNGEHVGVTPLKRVLNGRRGMAAPAVVTAHAAAPDQRCQTQSFAGTSALPNEIHFDFNR